MKPRQDNRSSLGRVLVAFVVGPIVASTVVAPPTLIMQNLVWGKHPFEFSLPAVSASVFLTFCIVNLVILLLFEYLTAAVVGVGGYLWLRHTGWRRRSDCFLLGAGIGCVTALVVIGVGVDLTLDSRIPHSGSGAGYRLVLVSALTLVTGLVFAWLLPPKATNSAKVAATFD